MQKVKRRAIYYLTVIALLITVSTVLYDVGMKTFEPGPYPPADVDISILHSLQVVVETFTATGYGSDSPWLSNEMNAFVVLLDLTGVFLFFLALPAVFLPLLQRALSTSAPREVDEELADHVIICTYTPRSEVLIEELESNEVPYVLVEPDRDRATELHEDDYEVVHADPESVTDLKRVNLAQSRALVADVSDRIDASIVLAAKEACESCRVISVVEEPGREPYHRLAGADVVLSPRKLLGEGLAQKVTTGISTELGDAIDIGEDFDIMEVPIRHGTELEDETLADSNIRERYGVNVIGAWFRGEFGPSPSPEQTLDSGTILLVTGNSRQLERLAAQTQATVRRYRRGETVIIGSGEVGGTVRSALAESGLPYTVIDRADKPGVDVIGDATDPDVLQEAGVQDARSIVLAIPDDTETGFATLVTRDLNRSGEVIARADNIEAIRKTYRAGADYVLSLATVSGRSIVSEVLDGENILSVGTQVEVLRTGAGSVAGDTLAEARIRERTGCTVIAVERNSSVFTDLDPDFRIRKGDQLVIAGTDEGTNRFMELFE